VSDGSIFSGLPGGFVSRSEEASKAVFQVRAQNFAFPEDEHEPAKINKLLPVAAITRNVALKLCPPELRPCLRQRYVAASWVRVLVPKTAPHINN
jgi:hypothetical protein